MPSRQFNVTCTANYQSAYDLITAITGAIPTDGFFPKTVKQFGVNPDVASAATYGSRADVANNTGYPIANPMNFGPHLTNVVDLTNQMFKGAGATLEFIVTY